MYKKLLFSLFTVFSYTSFSQNISFSDDNLYNAIINAGVDTNNDKIIQVDEAEAIHTLDIGFNDIKNIDGLSYFINLDTLDIAGNKFLSADLSTLTKLIHLEINSSSLSDLTLTGLTNLEYINMSNIDITTLDLSGFSKLKELNAHVCYELQNIDLSGTSSLTKINLFNTELISFDITDSPLLENLSVSGSFPTLDLSKNPLLNYLQIRVDSLAELDLSFNPQITSIFLIGNEIEELDLSNNTELTTITILLNSLTSLDVSHLNKLSELAFWSADELQCLSVLPNSLQYLGFSNETKMSCIANLPNGITSDLPLCNATNNENQCDYLPTISGNIYTDLDLELDFDESEYGYEGVKLSIPSTGDVVYTDEDGNYAYAFTELGNYTFTVEDVLYYDEIPSTFDINVESYDDLFIQDIALQANESIDDLEVSIVSYSTARPGFDMYYVVEYVNSGTNMSDDVILTFEMPSEFELADSITTPIIDGNSLTYQLGELSPQESGRIWIYGTTNIGTLGIEEQATISIEDLNQASENTPNNNTDTINYTIVGSYDPNDKLGLASISPTEVSFGIDMEYRIRFQNTGTDTAFNIVITDTLSSLVDLNSLKVLSSSHTMNAYLDSNVLIMEFNDILLADSNTNEPLSHGYVFYSIKPLSTVTIDDTIHNTANIYFDYNTPVITNTFSTIIQEPQVLTAFEDVINEVTKIVYPNPTIDVLYFDLDYDKIKVFDLTGKEHQVIALSDHQISVEHLPSGSYFMKFILNDGSTYSEKFIKTN